MSESSGIGIGDEGREGERSKTASALSSHEDDELSFFCGVRCARRPEEKNAEYSSLSVVGAIFVFLPEVLCSSKEGVRRRRRSKKKKVRKRKR